VDGLTIGTTYTFTVHATNGVGDSPESGPSNEVTPTPVGKPSPPLTPAAATLNQAAYVSCTAPFQDGGSPIVSYEVRSNPGGTTATRSSCPILVTGLTNGTTYTFTVTATNEAGGTSEPSAPTGPVTPHEPSGGPPSNDDWANAQPISGSPGSVVGINVGATHEDGEPQIQDRQGGASVWYVWTAPADGEYRFDTCDQYPGMASQIEGFIGNRVDALQGWGSGPNTLDGCPLGRAGAVVQLTAPAGLKVYMKVDGLNEWGTGPSQGVFTLNWGPWVD
jgi:hypothetical protein